MTTWRRVLVVQSGALGDSVLVWPLLRALVRAGATVVFAARPSHARLAAPCIDPARITPADADAPALTRLWSGDGDPAQERFDGVITFLADDATSAGRTWLSGAARVWPGAEIVAVGPPGSPSRMAMWNRARVADLGGVAVCERPSGPAVIHVGAGSRAKRWPLDRFAALAESLSRRTGVATRFLAGEVEFERFQPEERDRFSALGGRYLTDLDELVRELDRARLVVGNDSGPAHLSAQLGLSTLAIFGPTDPRVWTPVGPGVCVLAPSAPGSIESIGVGAAVEAAARLLDACSA